MCKSPDWIARSASFSSLRFFFRSAVLTGRRFVRRLFSSRIRSWSSLSSASVITVVSFIQNSARVEGNDFVSCVTSELLWLVRFALAVKLERTTARRFLGLCDRASSADSSFSLS
jgi:hypothetical protein